MLAAFAAVTIFTEAMAVPAVERLRGDAINYLIIANQFRSVADAFEFAGDRTYGFPLFLYLIRKLLSGRTFLDWLNGVSYALFTIHLLSSICFYRAVLRPTFRRAMLPEWTAALAGALIMTYPGLVGITTTLLTDAFCVDLLMLAGALLFVGNQSGDGKKANRSLLVYQL